MITLKKAADKDFIILNLTDPQMRDPDWEEDNFRKPLLIHTVKTLVDRVHPDLITISGDLASAGHYISYRNLADLLDSCGVPWAPVWGNHDNQFGPEAVDNVVKEYKQRPLFLYEEGDPSIGNGNYVILIEENGRPVHGLIMTDSHHKVPVINENGETKYKYAKLLPEQMVWYGQQCEELKKLGCEETTMILHIPIYAYHYAFEAAFLKGLDPKEIRIGESSSPVFWNEGYKDSFGVSHEKVHSHYQDDFVFEEILRHGSTKTIICGHDHKNNWVVNYKGVRFAYGLKTGAGCTWRPYLSGGTVMRITSDGLKDLWHEYVSPDEFIK